MKCGQKKKERPNKMNPWIDRISTDLECLGRRKVERYECRRCKICSEEIIINTTA